MKMMNVAVMLMTSTTTASMLEAQDSQEKPDQEDRFSQSVASAFNMAPPKIMNTKGLEKSNSECPGTQLTYNNSGGAFLDGCYMNTTRTTERNEKTGEEAQHYLYMWKHACAFTKWVPSNQFMYSNLDFNPETMTLERFGFIGMDKQCFWGSIGVLWKRPLPVDQILPNATLTYKPEKEEEEEEEEEPEKPPTPPPKSTQPEEPEEPEEPKVIQTGKLMNKKSPNDAFTCLGVKEEKPKVGTTLEITECGDADDQVWEHWSNGQLKHKPSGFCVGIKGPQRGKKLQLNKCYGNRDSQKWSAQTTKDIWFTMKNKQTNMCIDLPWASGKEGLVAQLWNCQTVSDTDNMEYKWVDPKEATTPVPVEPKLVGSGKVVNLKAKKDAYLCIGAKDAKPKVGTQLRVEDCGAANENIWEYYDNGHVVEKSSGLCVDVNGKNNGAKLFLNTCKDTDESQEWEKGMETKNWFHIKHSLSGKCIDLPGGGIKKGMILQLWTCYNEKKGDIDNFRYQMVDPEVATRPPVPEPKLIKEGKLQNRVSPKGQNLCLGTADVKPKINSRIQITDCGLANQNVWQIYDDGAFMHKQSGLCLDTRSKNRGAVLYLNKCKADDKSQDWTPVKTTGEWNEYKNAESGLCLDLPGAAATKNMKAIQWTCFGKVGAKDNFEYKWLPADYTPPGPKLLQEGKLMNRKSPVKSKLCFGFSEDKPKAKSVPKLTACGEDDDNVWQLYDDGRFVEKKSGLCLDTQARGNGKLVMLQKCNANDKDQQWTSRKITTKFVQFKNTGSGRCIDLPGYGGTNNLRGQLWSCSNQGTKDNMEYMWI